MMIFRADGIFYTQKNCLVLHTAKLGSYTCKVKKYVLEAELHLSLYKAKRSSALK